MRNRLLLVLLVFVLIGLSWISTLNLAFSVPVSPDTKNYESSYKFAVQNGYYKSDHTLYVSLPPSFKEYYNEKSHALSSTRDFARFVTPGAVQSIADNIRSLTRKTPYDEEEFANAVLTIVREITYFRSDVKYPLETIADNQADCDGLSILAASIMKAAGLDVVLLLYNDIFPSHMNIGVHLDQKPVSHSWWTTPSGIEYNNKTYWIGECTSQSKWAVGERPVPLISDNPEVIPLDSYGKESSACVSSSLDNGMQPSSISINLSPDYSDVAGNERTIRISGTTVPALPNRTVIFFVDQPGYSPSAMVVVTDESGNYFVPWNVSSPGTYSVKTSWSGFSSYSGSDSEALTVSIGARPILMENAISFTDSGSTNILFDKKAMEFLKDSYLGTEITLRGDFMVLSDGHEIPPNETIVTIPAHKTTYRPPGSRQTVTLQVPEKNETLQGAELLNGHFGFILECSEEINYTASVKLLSSDETTQITQSSHESEALFLNASDVAMKNVWHTAVVKVSDAKAAMEIYDEAGNLINREESNTLSQLSVIVTYPVGQVLAFRKLKVESINQRQSSTPISKDQNQVSGYDLWSPYIRTSLLLAGAGLAIVRLRDRKIGNIHSNEANEKRGL